MRARSHRAIIPAWVALLTCGGAVPAQTPPLLPDIPPAFARPRHADDYVKREQMVPMRDGVRLYTVIVTPKGIDRAPIILTRTPYNASRRSERSTSPSMRATLPLGDEMFAAQNYIRVFQDIRGKYASEGDYVMNRPLRGDLNRSEVDHSTDTYDTMEWLVRNLPESNGRIGLVGSSYEGYTVLMGLVNPHPALKVAVAINPMVDNWKGDDWFHNGAFRQVTFDYLQSQTTAKADGKPIARGTYDLYTDFLSLGSADAYARHYGIDQLPFYRKLTEHPAYDSYWQQQAVDAVLARERQIVPTMHVASLWDAEDIYGAVAAYAATEPQDVSNGRNYLVLGPWRHSGANYDGATLGPMQFEGDTALQFRRDVLQPFLDEHLKDGASRANTAPVHAFETGTNVWRRHEKWPLSCNAGCPARPQRLYLRPGFRLGESPQEMGWPKFDEYVSDPAKPVPYVARPIRFDRTDAWKLWLVSDQRAVADRTDVLTYQSEVLTKPLRLSGAPTVNLYASTSGSDSDWIVKLIDVYPDEVPSRAELAGYQLGIAMEIFRGRYRESLSEPRALTPGKVHLYRFPLPHASHVFLPGHRIMVQVQSTWFPLYDRNPQTFVENIFFAQPADYRKATQRVYRAADAASFVELPVVPSQ